MAIRSVTAALSPSVAAQRGDRPATGASETDKGPKAQEAARERLEEPAIRAEISAMAARDREVRAHEAAHAAAGGSLVRGGPSFETEAGPDGKQYAVGGEVQIDTSAADDPRATLAKMRQVRAAALAPASPSGQDQAVAARASAVEAKAVAELAEGVAEGEGTTGAEGQDTGATRQAGATPRTDARDAPKADATAPQGGSTPTTNEVADVGARSGPGEDAPDGGNAGGSQGREQEREDPPAQQLELPFPQPWEGAAANGPVAMPWLGDEGDVAPPLAEEPDPAEAPPVLPWERAAAMEERAERTHLWPDPWDRGARAEGTEQAKLWPHPWERAEAAEAQAEQTRLWPDPWLVEGPSSPEEGAAPAPPEPAALGFGPVDGVDTPPGQVVDLWL